MEQMKVDDYWRKQVQMQEAENELTRVRNLLLLEMKESLRKPKEDNN